MKKKQNILVIALILLAVITFGVIILVSGKENTSSLETTKDIIKMINSINLIKALHELLFKICACI